MTSNMLTRDGTTSRATTSRPGGPIDPRVAARRVEVARDLGRRRLRRLLVLVALTIIVLAMLGALRSALLDVDHVRVTGVARSDAATVRRAVGVPRGRAMVSVDPGPAVARLERLPWVAHAEVERHWPGTVSVRITERVPVAVAGKVDRAVLVDRDGRILGPATSTDHLPVAGPDPAQGPGGRVPAPQRRVVRLLADLPPSLRSETVRGTLGPQGLGVVLTDGIAVRLGDDTRMRAKAEAVVALLSTADRSTIARIDVSVPGSATLTRHRISKEGA